MIGTDRDINQLIENLNQEQERVKKEYIRLALYSEKVSITEVFNIPVNYHHLIEEVVQEINEKKEKALKGN